MTKTIKELYKLVGSPFLFDPDTVGYPVIEGSTVNFIADYNTYKEELDRYFIHEYGNRLLDLESDNDEDAAEEWTDEIAGILRVYLQSWAFLYYTLNISYNPIYNVEEHTVNTYSEHVTGTEYGQDKTTDQYGEDVLTDVSGQKQRTDLYGQRTQTNGERTDGSTVYSVSFDATTEKETGRQTDTTGSQTITESQKTDTHTDASVTDTHTRSQKTDTHTRAAKEDTVTSGEHTVTIDREGNIGVVSATDLLINEERFRRNYSFFKNCFLTVITEIGAYYDTILL